MKLPWKNINLPVYYGKIDRKEYYIKYFTYTDEEMKHKLSDNFEKFISGLQQKGVQIVEKNVRIDMIGGECITLGTLSLIQEIGEQAPVGQNTGEQEETGS